VTGNGGITSNADAKKTKDLGVRVDPLIETEPMIGMSQFDQHFHHYLLNLVLWGYPLLLLLLLLVLAYYLWRRAQEKKRREEEALIAEHMRTRGRE
jgi:hypothetical protein